MTLACLLLCAQEEAGAVDAEEHAGVLWVYLSTLCDLGNLIAEHKDDAAEAEKLCVPCAPRPPPARPFTAI